MKNLLKEFLDAGNFITVNKTLIKKLGLMESVLIGYFINQHNYFDSKNMLNKDDEFFCKNEDIVEYTGLTEHFLRTAKQSLLEHKLIQIKKRGVPGKNFYKINYENIEKLFENNKQNTTRSELHTPLEMCQAHDINKPILDLPRIEINTLLVNKVEGFENTNPKQVKHKLTLPNKDFPYIEIINNIQTDFLDSRLPTGRTSPIFFKHKLPIKSDLTTTKTIITLVNKLKSIESGEISKFKYRNGFIKASEYLKDKDRTNIKALLKESIINFLTFFEPNNFPENKGMLPHTLNDFIYNPRSESSWFLKCLEEKSNTLRSVIAQKIESNIDSVFLDPYVELFEDRNPMVLETKRQEIIENVRNLHKWWKDWAFQFGADIVHIGDNYFKVNTESAFVDYHINYIKHTFTDLQPGHILVNGTAFKMFLKYCGENEIDFDNFNLCFMHIQDWKKEKEDEPKNKIWEEIKKDVKRVQEEFDSSYNPTKYELDELFDKRFKMCMNL
jgi:hypothetical protein